MQLIYLSPVPWSSFAQRPHKFVSWFHGSTGEEVLWLDPYLTRFPVPTDFRYLRLAKGDEQHDQPGWIKVLKPYALPIEPLCGSGWANTLIWRQILADIDSFANRRATLLVIGKPSVLALIVLERLRLCRSVYDAMDNFPMFYSGLSRFAMRKREDRIVSRVSAILVSSTGLKQRWQKVRPDIQLVHNGLDASSLPALKIAIAERETKVFGYTGTIAAWFDWDWVAALAKTRPKDVVRLIGPVFTPVPVGLPRNVKILPPCDHLSAMEAMHDFDIGLIPFKKNELTASVDPIKYYEYMVLGLPIISTDFGEMALREGEEGVFLSFDPRDISDVVERALCHKVNHEALLRFKESNSWRKRFDGAKIM